MDLVSSRRQIIGAASDLQLLRLHLQNLLMREVAPPEALKGAVNGRISQEYQSELASYPIFQWRLRSDVRKIDPETSCYQIIGYVGVNLQYQPALSVVNAKPSIVAEILARATGKFPLDTNYADCRAFPLRDRG
jgi:hypothetical protein